MEEDDQFTIIPEGNGVASNGVEHVDEDEMFEVPPEVGEEEEMENGGDKDSAKGNPTDRSPVTVATVAEVDVAMEASAADNALKRKIDATANGGESEIEVKKQKPSEENTTEEATESESAVAPPVVEAVVVEENPHPKLPELAKYWKPVLEDATNFNGWTYLLQYVDQETDAVAAREAYNAFLGNYPYCYGYWRKYADYEKNKGDRSKCDEVFERGLKAIPLSMDLWIHYLNYVKATHPDAEALIRSQYERALDICGLEFRSDKLWESYIKWETEGKRLQRVTRIYDRLLNTPTLAYNTHFGSFSDFIKAHAPKTVLDEKELQELQKAVTEEEKKVEKTSEKEGEEAPKKQKKLTENEIEEAVRKRVIADRKRVHEATVKEVTNRWTFEEGVKRPYFHVKPLERCQLKNWMDYLEYEIERGDRRRIVVLFERCLIACALYEEYWQKFASYLMDQAKTAAKDEAERESLNSTTRDVFARACNIHHKEKPRLHLMWAAFEECQGGIEKAAQILANIDGVVPNLLLVEYRRINVERRRGNFELVEELFRKYVIAAKNQAEASSLTIKHARFVHRIRKDLDRALEVLRVGQASDPQNVRIPLQMIDLAMQRESLDEDEVLKIMNEVLAKEDLDLDQRVLFVQRKAEFLEDFGMSPQRLQDAQKDLVAAKTKLQELKKAKSLENNNAQMHSRGSGPQAQQQQPPQHQHQHHHTHQQQQGQGQYANYSNYYGAAGRGGADGSAAGATAATAAYGSYSETNYWNQYGQSAGNNNYYGNYNYQ